MTNSEKGYKPLSLSGLEGGKPPSWGVTHTLSLALVALDLDVVSRATLRALLPTEPRRKRPNATRTGVQIRGINGMGQGARRVVELGLATDIVPERRLTRAPKNKFSVNFQIALGRLEASGWISRGEKFILVRDRRGLLDWATSAELPEVIELSIQPAIDALLADEAKAWTEKLLLQRDQELRALKRLMEGGLGSHWSGRGSVRFVPRSSPYLPEEQP